MFIPPGLMSQTSPVTSLSTVPDYSYPATLGLGLVRRDGTDNTGKPTDPHGLVLEGWAQGYMVGSLIVIACITVSNMRKGVLLHKLILLELILGIWHGFWILLDPPVYAWWLSISAIPLNISWILHNVIAWIKIKPFLGKWSSIIFITTVCLTIPYWIIEIYANFAYFHNINNMFLSTRPFEALCRDPWWIFTTISLIYNIKVRYELRLLEVIRISPRFAVMLGAMFVSICFIIVDVCAVTEAFKSSLPVGINPFWKLAFVFKCLTDAVILDDFKTALDRLRHFKNSIDNFTFDINDLGGDSHLNQQWNQALQSRIDDSQPSADAEASAKRAERIRQMQLTNPAAFSSVAMRAARNSDPEKDLLSILSSGPSSSRPDDPPRGRRSSHVHRNQSSRTGMLAGSDTDTECDSFERDSHNSRDQHTLPGSSRLNSAATPGYISHPPPVSPGSDSGAGPSSIPNTFGLGIDQVIPDLPLDPTAGVALPSQLHAAAASSSSSQPPPPSSSPSSSPQGSQAFHMPNVNGPRPSPPSAVRRIHDDLL